MQRVAATGVKYRATNQQVLPTILNQVHSQLFTKLSVGNNQIGQVPSKCFGTHTLTSEDESKGESINKKKMEDQHIKEIEQQINKYALKGPQLKNVAVNFSIIKQNEFKSLIQVKDIGAEELEFNQVQNLERTQDHQVKASSLDRSQRSIFIESINQFIPHHRFSDQYAVQYYE